MGAMGGRRSAPGGSNLPGGGARGRALPSAVGGVRLSLNTGGISNLGTCVGEAFSLGKLMGCCLVGDFAPGSGG